MCVPSVPSRSVGRSALARLPVPAFSRSNYSSIMHVDDMVLVSVDDHLVEPPGLFEGRMPARYQELAPKVVTRADGSDVWVFNQAIIPNIGLNAVSGRPKEEYGVEPTAY